MARSQFRAEALEPRRLLAFGDIAGTVYHDLDGDGVRDAGEPGIPGRTIYVDGEPRAQTGAGGNYLITGLPMALYGLSQGLPAGWWQSQPRLEAYTSYPAGGDQPYDVPFRDFGAADIAPSYISGVAYDDTDGDGKRDPGEPPAAGRGVWFDFLNDRVVQLDSEPRVITDAEGRYTLGPVGPGRYVVRCGAITMTEPAGYTAHRVELAVGQHLADLNFGIANVEGVGSTAGYVYDDPDADGFVPFGAPAREGVTVFLDSNENGLLDAGERSTVTNWDGYWFDRLTPGRYVVRVVEPAGYRQFEYSGTPVPRVATISLPFGTFRLMAPFNLAPLPPAPMSSGAGADAEVRGGTFANQNFGSAPELTVARQAAPGQTSDVYLRFDLSAASVIRSAKLRVFGSATAGEVLVGLHAAPGAQWSEDAITAANAPAVQPAALQSQLVFGGAPRVYEWDATTFVRAQKDAGAQSVTLVLRCDGPVGPAAAVFASDEAADAARRPRLSFNDNAPPVAELGASASSWSQAFRSQVRANGLGDAGYALPLMASATVPAADAPSLPWTNLNRLTLKFRYGVPVRREDLVVRRPDGSVLPAAGYTFDPYDRIATWTFATPFGGERLTVSLNPAVTAGAPGTSPFHVLPGDVGRDGRVAADDLLRVRRLLLPHTVSGRNTFTAFADVTGDGRVGADDAAAVRANIGRALPPPAPPAPALLATARNRDLLAPRARSDYLGP